MKRYVWILNVMILCAGCSWQVHYREPKQPMDMRTFEAKILLEVNRCCACLEQKNTLESVEQAENFLCPKERSETCFSAITWLIREQKISSAQHLGQSACVVAANANPQKTSKE